MEKSSLLVARKSSTRIGEDDYYYYRCEDELNFLLWSASRLIEQKIKQ